jgi:hypothetical protein
MVSGRPERVQAFNYHCYLLNGWWKDREEVPGSQTRRREKQRKTWMKVVI